MKVKNKKFLLCAFALSACATLAFGVQNAIVSSADGEAVETTVASTISASVRIADETYTTAGVRFKIRLDEQTYTSTVTKGVETYTLLIPSATLGANKLTYANADKKIETTGKWYAVTENEGEENEVTYMESCVFVYDIPSANFASDIVVKGYFDSDVTDSQEGVYTSASQASLAWVANSALNSDELTPDEKASLKADYLTYTLNYYVDGTAYGEANQAVVYGDELVEPTAPEKANYTFGGWFNKAGTAEWDFAQNTVKGNMNLYAKFTQTVSTLVEISQTGADAMYTISHADIKENAEPTVFLKAKGATEYTEIPEAYITAKNGTVTLASSYHTHKSVAPGEYSILLKNNGDEILFENVNIYKEVIKDLVELSKDTNDAAKGFNVIANANIKADDNRIVYIKAKGASEYTQLPNDAATGGTNAVASVTAGKVTLFGWYLRDRVAAGEYSVLVKCADTYVPLGNVIVYNDVITDYATLKNVLKYSGTNAASPVSYGAGTYYRLGNDINAEAATHNANTATVNNAGVGQIGEFGFRGYFDGAGFTIYNVKLATGGLFGHIGKGAIVKNFGLIAEFGNYYSGLLCDVLGGGATIENVYVKASINTEVTCVSGIAKEVYGATSANKVQIRNVVLDLPEFVVSSTATQVWAKASSYLNVVNGNAANVNATNVHVISDNYLFRNSTAPSDTPNATSSNGVPTRYGANATYATFAARYTDASTALAEAALSASYWTYTEGMSCPVFTSAVNYLA